MNMSIDKLTNIEENNWITKNIQNIIDSWILNEETIKEVIRIISNANKNDDVKLREWIIQKTEDILKTQIESYWLIVKFENIIKDFETNKDFLNNEFIIIDFIENFPLIFSDFLALELSYNSLDEFIDWFLEYISNKLEIYMHYQEILDDNLNVVFKESLIRVKQNDFNLNHFVFIKIHMDLWKTINIFQIVLEKIFIDISKWKIDWDLSINAEVSDIKNPDFIPTIERLRQKYWIDLSLIKIEILENQEIPKTIEFKEKLKELNRLWIKIALDDLDIIDDWFKQNTIENVFFYKDQIEIIKIDWDSIKMLYKMHKSNDKNLEQIIEKLKFKFSIFKESNIKIIAEYIENLDMYYFVKDILWINNFQWFYSLYSKNIEKIRENLEKKD